LQWWRGDGEDALDDSGGHVPDPHRLVLARTSHVSPGGDGLPPAGSLKELAGTGRQLRRIVHDVHSNSSRSMTTAAQIVPPAARRDYCVTHVVGHVALHQAEADLSNAVISA
jgi:hypothetical protein